jgi:hypothetical protein
MRIGQNAAVAGLKAFHERAQANANAARRHLAADRFKGQADLNPRRDELWIDAEFLRVAVLDG